VIRIDVEHGIVSPVVENYDIVFAMLEAPLPSTGIVIRRVSSLERGLYAAPSLLEKHGEPHSLEDLAKLPVLTGPNDAPWAITTPDGVTEHLDVHKARLVSSNADIRLQAALAGHGVLRVTASFTNAAVTAGLLRRILTDHICEPLSVHALLPARQFVPAKVRCFLDALEAHARDNAVPEDA
jgi:DNA-binding transcriptional LysR family regulator